MSRFDIISNWYSGREAPNPARSILFALATFKMNRSIGRGWDEVTKLKAAIGNAKRYRSSILSRQIETYLFLLFSACIAASASGHSCH